MPLLPAPQPSTTPFRWAAVEGASSYRVVVAAEPEFVHVVGSMDDIEAPDVGVPPSLPPDAVWRVAAVDAKGLQGPWSQAHPTTELPGPEPEPEEQPAAP